MTTEPASTGREDVETPAANGAERAELEELRDILVGRERADLERLHRRLDDPSVRAAELAGVLPAAVKLGAEAEGSELTDALAAPVAEAMHRSVREDPKSLSDALFPVMGPAIRKAIVETVRGMIESTNRAIEASLSWEGLKWRVEALRSGKSFAEVAMLHGLVYRVEQLLLIHKETGLLLRQVVAAEVESPNGDLVSGMLTAIRDFVQDSFGTADGDGLNVFRVGELQVLVEDSPHAVLAAVVRGEAPAELRVTLQEALEGLAARYSGALKSFDGDAAAFEQADDLLRPCLRSQHAETRPRRRGMLWLVWAVVLAVGIGLVAWRVWRVVDDGRWHAAARRLDDAAGVVVTGVERDGRRMRVAGLRDPRSDDPLEVLGRAGVDTSRAELAFELYQSSEDAILRRRADAALSVPAGVVLDVVGGVLRVAGEADAAWARQAAAKASTLAWLQAVDFGDLVVAEERLLESEIARVESLVALMELDSTRLLPESLEVLDQMALGVARILDLADVLDEGVLVLVAGHTDLSGDEVRNERLSERRAEVVRELLVERGVPAARIEVRGLAAREYHQLGGGEVEARANRRVTISVERLASTPNPGIIPAARSRNPR